MSGKSFGFITVVFIIIASALIGGLVGSPAQHVFSTSGKTPASRQVEESYDEAVTVVSENYADDIDYEKANQAAIQGMLSTLDPHSNFFTRADYERFRQEQDSRYVGIGVSILRHHDGVYVQSTFEGAPAARAGLRFGDRLVEVDGKDVREWTTAQVSGVVRGVRGESVTIKIERAGANAPLYKTIVRDSVPLPSIRTAYMIRPGTGYVGLAGGFTHTTADELREVIDNLQKEGLRQVVLDLRNNPGGLLDQAISVSSQFLPRDKTIVSVRGRDDEQSKVYKNIGTDPVEFPVVVLINRNSASASEIVAGAIQDHGRGLVVGETSFGKGLVQRLFPLPLGAGLTLTTAKYYTPYGRLIQRDYAGGSFYDYYARHDAASEPQPAQPGAPTLATQPNRAAPRAIPTPAPTPQPTPLPIGPAIKTAAGRVFYGGGGITPDIDVKPLDITTPARQRVFEAAFFFTRELAAGLIPGFENYRITEPQFGHALRPTDYPVNDRIIEAFRSFVSRTPELELTLAQLEAEIDYARLRIREDLVTAAYGNEAGGRVLLENDPQLLRAIDALPEARRLAENIGSGSSVN